MLSIDPIPYKNRFGMYEQDEEFIINQTIHEFCTNFRNEKHDDLYMLLYEHIQNNLEKFLPEPDNE